MAKQFQPGDNFICIEWPALPRGGVVTLPKESTDVDAVPLSFPEASDLPDMPHEKLENLMKDLHVDLKSETVAKAVSDSPPESSHTMDGIIYPNISTATHTRKIYKTESRVTSTVFFTDQTIDVYALNRFNELTTSDSDFCFAVNVVNNNLSKVWVWSRLSQSWKMTAVGEEYYVGGMRYFLNTRQDFSISLVQTLIAKST